MLSKGSRWLWMVLFALSVSSSRSQDLNVLRQTDSLKNELRKSHSDSARFFLLKEIAADLSDQQVDSALNYALAAKDLAESKRMTRQLGAAYFTCGVVYMNKTDNPKALQYYFKALRIFEKDGKHENAMKCYNNIGVVYINLQRKEEAKKYFLKALEIHREHNIQVAVGRLYISIGSVSSGQGKFDEAQVYYLKALEEGRRTESHYQISLSLINLAEDHITRGKTAIARKYAQEALSLNIKRNDQHHLAMCYYLLGFAALKERKFGEAEKYLRISTDYSEKAGISTRVKETTEMLSQVYFEQRRYKEAYEMRRKYEALKDSAINEEVNREVSRLQSAYELERKNNQISLLSKDKEIAESVAAKEYLFRNILILAVIVVLVLAAILFRNVTLKQKLNEALSKKNVELKQENISAKYEVLKSKIDPHFLFNSLSALQSLIMKDQAHAIGFVEKFSELYRMILDASEYELVTLEREMIIVNNYLYLQQVKSGHNIISHITIEASCLKLLIPSFSVQMAVENAIKHNVVSSSKQLHINITAQEQHVKITNNLQPRPVKVTSTFTGHKNIAGRYELLMSSPPRFYEEDNMYIALLPLLPNV